VLNNPLRYVDPRGTEEKDWLKKFEKMTLEQRAKHTVESRLEHSLEQLANKPSSETGLTAKQQTAAKQAMLRHRATQEPLAPQTPPLQPHPEAIDENPFSLVPFVRAGWLLGEAIYGETISGHKVNRSRSCSKPG